MGTGQDQQLLHGPCRKRAPLGTAGLEAGPSHQVSRQSALHLLGGGRQAWSIDLRPRSIPPNRALSRCAGWLGASSNSAWSTRSAPSRPPTERLSRACARVRWGRCRGKLRKASSDLTRHSSLHLQPPASLVFVRQFCA